MDTQSKVTYLLDITVQYGVLWGLHRQNSLVCKLWDASQVLVGDCESGERRSRSHHS